MASISAFRDKVAQVGYRSKNVLLNPDALERVPVHEISPVLGDWVQFVPFPTTSGSHSLFTHSSPRCRASLLEA